MGFAVVVGETVTTSVPVETVFVARVWVGETAVVGCSTTPPHETKNMARIPKTMYLIFDLQEFVSIRTTTQRIGSAAAAGLARHVSFYRHFWKTAPAQSGKAAVRLEPVLGVIPRYLGL